MITSDRAVLCSYNIQKISRSHGEFMFFYLKICDDLPETRMKGTKVRLMNTFDLLQRLHWSDVGWENPLPGVSQGHFLGKIQ